MLSFVSFKLPPQTCEIMLMSVSSMSGAMLILLAACQVPTLKSLIDLKVLKMGDHLKQLFQEWRKFLVGSDSPSVDQSLWIINEADRFIKESYQPSLITGG